jgi:hypothetical protein
MQKSRLLKFLAGHELGLVSTLVFAGLYTWPFLTFDRPSATFRFIFAAWILHIVLIATASYASKRLEDGGAPGGPESDPSRR